MGLRRDASRHRLQRLQTRVDHQGAVDGDNAARRQEFDGNDGGGGSSDSDDGGIYTNRFVPALIKVSVSS